MRMHVTIMWTIVDGARFVAVCAFDELRIYVHSYSRNSDSVPLRVLHTAHQAIATVIVLDCIHRP